MSEQYTMMEIEGRVASDKEDNVQSVNSQQDRQQSMEIPKQNPGDKPEFEDRMTKRQRRQLSGYPSEFTGPLSTRRKKSLFSTKRTPSDESFKCLHLLRRRSSVEYRNSLGINTWFKRDKHENTMLCHAYVMGLTTGGGMRAEQSTLQ